MTPDDEVRAELESDWLLWLAALLPTYATAPFAAHHVAFWEWLWAIDAIARPRPFFGLWPRGGAKSTSAEAACVALGARRRRRYGLYVSETQDQADRHVASVASMLESDPIAAVYPLMSERMVGRYGQSRGWRRNRLRTAAGFTLDALGLDTASRGAKVEDARPDFLVVDDVDDDHDSAGVTTKKLETLTRTVIPLGASHLAVLGIQNLVRPDSVFARIADGRADFLADRIVSGPIPALMDLEWSERDGSYVITAGTPTWPGGQPLAACQAALTNVGLSAFLSEYQHETEPPAGGMFDHLVYRRCAPEDVPELVFVSVWVDPAVTDTDQSDSQGIQADGLGTDGVIYRLWSWERRTSPLDAIKRALRKGHELGATVVGVETDQGGDTWQSVFREAKAALVAEGLDVAHIRFASEKAGAGHGPKAARAAKMLADYERGGHIVHVEGTHMVLERALRRFPILKPFDLVDASYWSWLYVKRRIHAPRGQSGADTLAQMYLPT